MSPLRFLFLLASVALTLGATGCKSGKEKSRYHLYEGDSPNISITGEETPGGHFERH